jgi:hypothetical protein
MKTHFRNFLGSKNQRIMGNVGKWDPWYRSLTKEEPYSDLRTYELGAAYLKDCDPIEDWGCGRGWFRRYMARQRYRGIDASKTRFADVIADLAHYRSRVDGIFIRHVLEHDWEWERILRNAVASFTKKLVVVIFTPFSQDDTKEIAYAFDVGVPDISFRYEDIVRNFEGLEWHVETLETDTQYRTETVFYVKKPPPSSA